MHVTARHVLIVELDGDPAEAEQRIKAALPDACVFGEVDPVDAALMVVERDLVAA